MAYSQASVQDRAERLGKSRKEVLATAAMTDRQAARFMGVAVEDVAEAPPLLIPTPGVPVVTVNGADLSATCTPVAEAVEYKLRTNINNGTWNEGPYRATPSWTVASAAAGAWRAQSKARAADGTESAWSASSAPVTVTAAAAQQAAAPKKRVRKAKSDE